MEPTPPNRTGAEAPAAAAPAQEGTPPSPTPPAAQPQPIKDYFYARVFALTTTAILGWVLYQIMLPFIGPLMWALFIAFLLFPVHVRLTKQLQQRENVSAALLTAGTFILLVGPLAGMGAAFIAQASDLVSWLQSKLSAPGQTFQSVADMPVVGPVVAWLHDRFGFDMGQIQAWINQAAQSLPKILAGLGGSIFMGAVNTVLAFAMMLFMLFFCVRDGTKWIILVRDLIPMTIGERRRLADHIAGVTRAVVFGTGITALVQGMVVGVAFLITGLGSSLVFAVLAALFALLPFGGTALVWIPATLVLVANDRWGMAVVMVIFGVLSSSLDNVLRPLLISGRAEIGTLTVFLGVLGGAAAFGPIGLFLGPVIIAFTIALIQFAQEHRHA